MKELVWGTERKACFKHMKVYMVVGHANEKGVQQVRYLILEFGS